MSTLEIRSFPSPLPEPFKSQYLTLKKISFEEHDQDTPAEIAEHADRYYCQKDWFIFFVAIEDHQVIGAVTTLKRSIDFQGKQITLGGIGGVCTHPDYRKKGIATKLLTQAMRVLKESNCDIGYLCTDITDPNKVALYEKFGFQILGREHTYAGKSGTRYTDHDAMVAPIKSKKVYEAVMKDSDIFDIGVGNW